MSSMQKLSLIFVIAVAALVIYLSHLNTPAESPPATTASQEKEEPPVHPMLMLAQHHCAGLTPDSETRACIDQITADIRSGKMEPQVPEVNPLACNGIAEPEKLYECHGRMGHDFAVSTGDTTKCDVIPQDAIKASCKRLIVINEIKKLYALENGPAAGENSQ